MELIISMERSGGELPVGSISGIDMDSAAFSYAESYISAGGRPISVSLPIQREPFTPRQTRYYFEGLLPEGFTRRTVAQWLHADEGDYLKILAALGRECLGALKVRAGEEAIFPTAAYEKLTIEQVRALAQEGATKSAELVTKSHLSLTGASGKVGLYYDEPNGDWYLPRGSAPSTHIVKQSHVRLNGIVTNEQLSVTTARLLGLDVPDSFIINTGRGEDEAVLFATKRYDRVIPANARVLDGLPVPARLHQEDFAQALGIASVAKYEQDGEMHMKAMFDTLRRVSADPIRDQLKLWDMVVFNYLLGNTDGHIKNYSLLWDAPMQSLRLAPAYDLVSTTVYSESTHNMAFSIGGRHSIDEIDRNAFRDAAGELGLGEKIALKRFDALAERFEATLREAADRMNVEGFSNVFDIRDAILRTGGIRVLEH